MSRKQLMLLMMLSAEVVANADNFIKEVIEKKIADGEKRQILNECVTIQKHHNKGFSLNKLDKYQKEVSYVSLLALLIEVIYAGKGVIDDRSPLFLLAHSLIIGGAVSNTFDRLYRKYVVDYLSFGKGRVIYNLSDLCIFTGVLAAVLDELNNIK